MDGRKKNPRPRSSCLGSLDVDRCLGDRGREFILVVLLLLQLLLLLLVLVLVLLVVFLVQYLVL